jgi:hypothetical protein
MTVEEIGSKLQIKLTSSFISMSESRVKVCLRIRPLVGKERGQRVTFSDCGDKRYITQLHVFVVCLFI